MTPETTRKREDRIVQRHRTADAEPKPPSGDKGEEPKDPAADAKSPLEDNDWKDQSQGPSHPLDDTGHKKQ